MCILLMVKRSMPEFTLRRFVGVMAVYGGRITRKPALSEPWAFAENYYVENSIFPPNACCHNCFEKSKILKQNDMCIRKTTSM